MTSTANQTIFKTALGGLGISSGTGSTLEVMSHDGCGRISVSGFRAGLQEADVPIDRLEEGDIKEHGNNYITATFAGGLYFTRYELSDLLHGRGWKLIGYSVSHDPTGTICTQLWSKHIKGSSKKH